MSKQSFVDAQIQNMAESREIPVEEAAREFLKQSESTDLGDTSTKHLWTDRGLKMTCEYAGHPWHEAWKIRR